MTTSCSTPASRERLLERSVVLGGDVLVGARLERKNRSLQLCGSLDRPRCPVPPFTRPAVETDRACKPVAGRRSEPGVPAAEAEAEREDRRCSLGAEVFDGGADVGLHALGRGLADVLHVAPVVVTLRHSGGATEVVERNGGEATLRQAQGDLLVEAVEPADIREDHDADARRVIRRRGERGEAVPVTCVQDEVLVRDGGAPDDRDRRNRVELEAHGRGD